MHPLSRESNQLDLSLSLSFVILDLNSIKSQRGKDKRDLTRNFSSWPHSAVTVFTSHCGPLRAYKSSADYYKPPGTWPCGGNSISLARPGENMKVKSVRWSLADICSFSPSAHLLALPIAWMFGMNLGRVTFRLAHQISLCSVLICTLNPAICAFLCLRIYIMYNNIHSWLEVILELKGILMGCLVLYPLFAILIPQFSSALSLPPTTL